MSELGARASGQGRIFQTSGDQYIQEHHHHYGTGVGAPLFGTDPPARHAGPVAPDSVRVPLVGRPPGILRNREELRDALTVALAGPGGDAHVVHGMGGCGKTALAHWLFTEAVRAHGRVGFWVNASERMSLRAGMLEVLAEQGKSEEVDRCADVVRDCERFLPPDHLTTVMARHAHAEALRRLGRFEEAAPVAERVLADRIRLQGPEHAWTLSVLCLTGKVAHGRGRTDEAIAIYERLIEARSRLLGPGHPFLAEHREDIARWKTETPGS